MPSTRDLHQEQVLTVVDEMQVFCGFCGCRAAAVADATSAKFGPDMRAWTCVLNVVSCQTQEVELYLFAARLCNKILPLGKGPLPS